MCDLNSWGSIASLISLLISIILLIYARKVRNAVNDYRNLLLLNKSLDNYYESLDLYMTQLNSYIEEFDINKIKFNLKKCQGELEWLSEKLSDKKKRKEIKKIIRKIKFITYKKFVHENNAIKIPLYYHIRSCFITTSENVQNIYYELEVIRSYILKYSSDIKNVPL